MLGSMDEIEQLKLKIRDLEYYIREELRHKIVEIDHKIKILYSQGKGTYQSNSSCKNPHKCPVCNGWGKQQLPLPLQVETTTSVSMCNACEGQGIVWG
jgi:DnaJ-class molecular chaperone